jgi:hypothetical protein
MATIAIPNRAFPPPDDVLAQAHVVLSNLCELTPELVESLGR